MELPRHIPLTEAAQRFNADHAELAQAVDAGKIGAAVPDWVAEEILAHRSILGKIGRQCG